MHSQGKAPLPSSALTLPSISNLIQLNRVSSASAPDAEPADAGAITAGSSSRLLNTRISNPEVPLLKHLDQPAKPSFPLLSDLLQSDEFLAAVSANGQKLRQIQTQADRIMHGPNQPSPFMQVALTKYMSRSGSLFVSSNILQESSGSGLSSQKSLRQGSGSGKLSGKSLSEKLPEKLKPKSEHAISKKDTTQRKKHKIARLEQEIRDKLSLVNELEEEKRILWSKEQKVHAAAQQQSPKASSDEPLKPPASSVKDSAISHTIASMIDSFKSQSGRGKANEVLKGFTTTDKFTIHDYCAIICSFVDELSDIVNQQQTLSGREESLDPELHPDVCSRLHAVMPKIESFINSAIILYAPIAGYALSVDLRDPSQNLIRDIGFWTRVREKIHLTPLQEANMHSIYRMYASLIQKETDNAAKILADVIFHSQQSHEASTTLHTTTEKYRSQSLLMDSLHSFRAVNQRFMMLSCMLSYLIMTSLSPWQKARMCALSFPSAPNLKLMMASLCHPQLAPHQGR